jgi:hypothetical protein
MCWSDLRFIARNREGWRRFVDNYVPNGTTDIIIIIIITLLCTVICSFHYLCSIHNIGYYLVNDIDIYILAFFVIGLLSSVSR